MKCLLISLICIGFTYSKDIVPFPKVKAAAEYYGKYIFGEAKIIDVQTYYGIDNQPIAYYFVFSKENVKKEQIEKEVSEGWTMLEEAQNNKNKLLMTQAWKKIRGEDKYKTLAISSRYYYPPLIYYWHGLPPHYVMNKPIKERIGKGKIIKYVFYAPYDVWAEIVSGRDTSCISLFSLKRSKKEEIYNTSIFMIPKIIQEKAFEKWSKIDIKEPLSQDSFRIEGVPDYQWSYGCSPTASAMLLGYWDTHGYPKLVDYYFDHYDVILGKTVEDVPNCQKELAITMNTDTAETGGTSLTSIAPGTQSVCDDPEWNNNYNFICDAFYNDHEKLIQMINGYHPVHWVLANHPYYGYHSVCAMGWGPPNTDYICIHDTWETTPEEVVISFEWEGGYSYVIPLWRSCEVALPQGIMDVSPALMDINGDGKQEIFLACDDGDGDGKGKVYAYDSDWNLLWTKDVQGNIGANPCVSDLDNDGNYELIVPTTEGYLYIFNCENGSNFSSWPKYINCSFSSPAVADFIPGGKKEIIIGTEEGVKIYSYNGNLLWEGITDKKFWAAPVIADLDNDGDFEIVAVPAEYNEMWLIYREAGEIKSYVRSIGTKGSWGEVIDTLLPQKYAGKAKSSYFNLATPAIADIDKDGWKEVILVIGRWGEKSIVWCGKIKRISGNWEITCSWSHEMGGTLPCVSSPAIANVDNDNKGEVIVVGNYDPGMNYIARMVVRCLEDNGSVKWAKAIGEYSFVYPFSSPALGDIDNDGKLEIVVGSDWGKIHGLNAEDGSFVGGPSRFALKMVASTPLLADIDKDNKIEIIATSEDHFVYCWEASASPQSIVEWGTFHQNNHNTGVYLRKPTNVSAQTISESEIKLSWQDNSLAENGFEILRFDGNNFIPVGRVSANITTYIDNDLDFGVTYQYKVRAFAGEYYSYTSNTASATTNILNPPTNLSATCSYPYNSVTLNWDDNSNYETGYEIYRKSIGGNYQKIAELPANTTSYTDNSVSQFQDYFYKVRAKSGNVYSNYSNIAWVTTSPVLVLEFYERNFT